MNVVSLKKKVKTFCSKCWVVRSKARVENNAQKPMLASLMLEIIIRLEPESN